MVGKKYPAYSSFLQPLESRLSHSFHLLKRREPDGQSKQVHLTRCNKLSLRSACFLGKREKRDNQVSALYVILCKLPCLDGKGAYRK